MKNAFYFPLKVIFVLKIFKFLSWLFGSYKKTTLLETSGQFQNLCHHNMVNKQLQCAYLPISQGVKTIKQWNWVS